MNKKEIEKAIEYFRAGNFLGKSMDKHINVAISVLEQQLNGGWIPISLRKPTMEECQENDCRFIVTDTNRTYQSLFDYKNKYFIAPRFDCSGWTEDACVMYWQPMPDRPKLNKEYKDAERN